MGTPMRLEGDGVRVARCRGLLHTRIKGCGGELVDRARCLALRGCSGGPADPR